MFVEYLLGSRSSINVGYVGNWSTELVTPIDGNQPLPGTGDPATWLPVQQRRPLYPFNPDIASISTTASRGRSNYNGLQSTFKQRLWRGLDFFANYTWSRAMANNSGYFGNNGVAGEGAYPMNSYDIEGDYGPAAYDARHIVLGRRELRSALRQEAQFGSDWNRALDAVAGGWSTSFALTAHTGFPITVTDGSNPSLQASRSPERPNRIASGELDDPTLERWIDRAAFVSAPRGSFGDAGRRHPPHARLLEHRRLREQADSDLRAAIPPVPGRDVQFPEPPELRPAPGEHPEHRLRHDHLDGRRCPRRPARGEVLF